MANSVRVYGKAQNRTALGIVNAYMVMYPHAKFSDLKQAFPDALNPDSGVGVNFIEYGQSTGPGNWDGYFTKEDELITTGDGKKVALVKMWTKPSFERLVAHAAQYGIEIAEFQASEGAGKKGGYRLEYLNGYVPPVPEKEEKKSNKLLWWILGLLLAAVIVFLILFLTKKPAPAEPQIVEVEKVVTEVDTVYVKQIDDIQKEFNALQFEVGKADLNDDSKASLYALAEVLKKNPEVKLKVVGHTSAEGNPDANQKLSEARAKAAVDFLIARGIDAERLSYEGKGSSEPIDENNLEANRRTEFIVVE